LAKKGTRLSPRNTQYLNFGKIPSAPFNGVLPEFITDPSPVNLLTLFRGEEGYEMRIARVESVDTYPREVHFEHTIFSPNVPLKEYFKRIAEIGACHHFALVHRDISGEIDKVAKVLSMKIEYLTD